MIMKPLRRNSFPRLSLPPFRPSALSPSLSPKSGQALAEFVVGLIAILALISCLTVGTSVITGHTESMATARKEAAAAASLGADTLSNAKYIKDWTPWTNPFESRTPGRRTSKFTKYDTATDANPSEFTSIILNKAVVNESDWNIIANAPDPLSSYDSKFTKLRGTTSFGLVKGEDSRNIPLDKTPFIPHFFGINKIDVECKVWLPQINGMY